MTHHETSIRRYLLSELGEPETAQLEGDLLEDWGLFESTAAIHGELVMDLASGKLSASEAMALENRLSAAPGGVETKRFYELLDRRLSGGATEPAKVLRFWPRGPMTSALLAAMLTLGASLAVLGPRSGMDPASPAAESSIADGPSAVPPVKSTFIIEPLTRSERAAGALAIAEGTELVGLWFEVLGAGEFLQVSIQTGDDVIARIDAPDIVRQPWGTYVAVELPADTIPASPFEVLIEQKRGEDWASVASYSVVIAKE